MGMAVEVATAAGCILTLNVDYILEHFAPICCDSVVIEKGTWSTMPMRAVYVTMSIYGVPCTSLVGES